MTIVAPVLFAVALSLSDVKAYLHSIVPQFENVTEPAVVVQRLPTKGVPLLLQYKVLGEYNPETNTITISENTLKRGRSDEMKDIMVHEMTHAWIAANKIDDKSDHGPAFKKKYREVC